MNLLDTSMVDGDYVSGLQHTGTSLKFTFAGGAVKEFTLLDMDDSVDKLVIAQAPSISTTATFQVHLRAQFSAGIRQLYYFIDDDQGETVEESAANDAASRGIGCTFTPGALSLDAFFPVTIPDDGRPHDITFHAIIEGGFDCGGKHASFVVMRNTSPALTVGNIEEATNYTTVGGMDLPVTFYNVPANTEVYYQIENEFPLKADVNDMWAADAVKQKYMLRELWRDNIDTVKFYRLRGKYGSTGALYTNPVRIRVMPNPYKLLLGQSPAPRTIYSGEPLEISMTRTDWIFGSAYLIEDGMLKFVNKPNAPLKFNHQVLLGKRAGAYTVSGVFGTDFSYGYTNNVKVTVVDSPYTALFSKDQSFEQSAEPLKNISVTVNGLAAGKVLKVRYLNLNTGAVGFSSVTTAQRSVETLTFNVPEADTDYAVSVIVNNVESSNYLRVRT